MTSNPRCSAIQRHVATCWNSACTWRKLTLHPQPPRMNKRHREHRIHSCGRGGASNRRSIAGTAVEHGGNAGEPDAADDAVLFADPDVLLVHCEASVLVAIALNSMRSEMANMRDEIRALSTTVLRMDGSVQSRARELGAIYGLLAEQSPPSPRLPPARKAHGPPATARAEFLPQRCFLLRLVPRPRG